MKHWTTLNEPWCSAFVGYAAGDHAPGLTLGSRSARAAHHLLLGHGLAIDALRAADAEASLGITLNLYSVQPASDSPADRDAARRIDGLHNRIFLDPVLTGQYPADVLTDMGEEEWFAANPPEDLAQIARPLDFLGINYYSRHTVAARAPVGGSPTAAHRQTRTLYPGSEHLWKVDTGGPRTFMGPICPEGLLDVLELANGMAPHLDLYITENGAPFDDTVEPDGTIQDPGRIDFLAQHVDARAQAIARGIPLRGYFVWSLMDNFEWAWGYSRRFGLVYVDFATQARTIKASGYWFRSFLEPPATQAT